MYITYFTLYYIIYKISVKESSIVQQRGNARKPSQAHKPQSGWDQLSSWSLLWPWLEENAGHEEVCLHVSTVSWNILNILWHHGLETSQTIESVILVTLEICIPASGHNLGRLCPGHHDHPALQRDVAIIGDGLKWSLKSQLKYKNTNKPCPNRSSKETHSKTIDESLTTSDSFIGAEILAMTATIRILSSWIGMYILKSLITFIYYTHRDWMT